MCANTLDSWKRSETSSLERKQSRERVLNYDFELLRVWKGQQNKFLPMRFRGTWAAQLVEYPALDIGSGRDFAFVRSNPVSGSVLGKEPAWDSLSPSLIAPPPLIHVHTCVLSLSQNK